MKNMLWYTKPTLNFMEGLPVGNGRLAAMALGTAQRLRVALNHEWLWRGENRCRDLEDVSSRLPEVREALLKGDYERGTLLANDAFGGLGGISGVKNRVDPYQPLGDLWVELPELGPVGDFRRQLDMERGLVTHSFRAGNGTVTEQLFISAADGCGVLTLTSEEPVAVRITLDRTEDPLCHPTRVCCGSTLTLEGRFDRGTAFAVEARVGTDGSCAARDGALCITGARSLTLLFNAGTDAKGCPAGEELTFPQGSADELLARHEPAFRSLLGPALLDIDLPESPLPTDERVEAFRRGEEPTVPLTYFHFGRYLMASGSSGELPLNLQGKWNEDLQPPWESDYHLDVNIQMCYWFTDMLGMDRASNTLFNLCERYVPHGREAARKLYNCRGTYFALQTDVWGRMTPESYGWAVWIGAAPWLAQHFFFHYLFTGDEVFLRERAYPFLREVAAFLEDYLIERDGQLVIVPSQSPENRFPESGDRFPVSLCTNCAMDIELTMEVLDSAIRSARILQVDEDKVALWEDMLRRLPPLKVGSRGQLLEWSDEFTEVEPGHRHFSPLYGLHPANLFTPGSDLEKAAERTMDLRLAHGGGHTGWSRSWTACFMARLGRPQEAWHHLTALIADFATVSLLDLHPPRIFQIDGNMGGTAAICEMLLRTLGDELYLLRGLPEAWPTGRAEHFRAHGGVDVSFSWQEGRLSSLTLLSPRDRTLTIHAPGTDLTVELRAGEARTLPF